MTIKMFSLEKFEDTSNKYSDPAVWIASSVAAYTQMMMLNLPEQFKKTTWSDRRDALKAALMDARLENESAYRPKEYVYTLRSWFLEGILDFLFLDKRIWKSGKWSIEEVRENTPKALSMLIEDIKED